MKLFFGVFVVFIFFISYLVVFIDSAFALTTPFRSATIVTTDGAIPYVNLENCSTTNDYTCDRMAGSGSGYLYFRGFGNYNDFGIPIESKITHVRVRVTGKASPASSAPLVNITSAINPLASCRWSNSAMWILLDLNSNIIKTQIFISKITDTFDSTSVKASCFESSDFENNNSFMWQIAYSQNYIWSANIDNFEIAFDYEPGPTSTPTPTLTPTPKTPLILIPGVGGSELKMAENFQWKDDNGHGGVFKNFYFMDEKVWTNYLQAALPGNDDYFDILRMNHDGQASLVDLALTETLFDGYNDTINSLTSDGYELDKTLFLFPYDWRLDIASTLTPLNDLINTIKTKTESPKVDIIAHSMGGLVARNYIADSTRAQNVRKLFTLGAPHLGSVDSLKKLRFGGCLTTGFWNTLLDYGVCLGVSPSEVKDVVQNMISVYELVPSQTYFNFYNGQGNKYLSPYKNNGQQFNYDEIKSFLTDLNYNIGLFAPSELFHVLDNSLTNTNGVEITNIAGSGLETLGQIREKSVKNFFGSTVQKKDGFSINGDQTVPLFSASLNDPARSLSLLGGAKVFYTNQNHGDLVASGSALNLVKNILDDNSQLPDGVSTQAYSFSGTEISVHSPVNIHVYDQDDNHTGPTNNEDFEENIPGSSYDILDDAKFIFLPNNGNYHIKFESTGQGDFDFKIRKYENDEISQELLYKDIPLTVSTKAETQLDTSSGQFPTIQLDEDGNGTIDQDIGPSSNLTGDLIYDEISPATDFQIYGTLGDNGWFKSDVIVTLISQDNEEGSGILKTEYSLDNGQTINTYTQPFTISSEKINKLKFRSVDNAGNEENPQEIEIKIDKTPPQVSIDASPKTLWPANNKMVNVKIVGNSSDLNLSDTRIEIYDEYRKIEPIIANFGQTIQLQASRNEDDLDGRKYTIRATVEDLAGNSTQALINVTVPHDQRR